MANHYAKLKRKFTENGIDIIYTEPLSYMNAILPKNGNVMSSKPHQKVIIICKKNHFVSKQINAMQKIVSNENSSNDLNLTGSPLRDTCDIDYIDDSMDSLLDWNNLWTEEDETYHPISLIRAQQILSEICMDVEARDKITFWAIGDHNVDNILLTFVELTADWNKRGTVTFMGQCSYDEMDLNRLESKHLTYISKSNNIMETTIDSYYQLNIENNNMKLQLSRSISGRLTSKTFKDFDRDSRMILHQSVPIDNPNSIIETFWRQIKILNMIKEAIVAFKETDDPNYLEFTVGTQELATVKQDIFTSFTEVASIYVQIEDDEKDSIVEIESVVNKAIYRENIELTDQLWSALKGSSTFDDLRSAFEFVLTCAVKYNVVNMPTNNNRLANWIRDLAEKRMAIPQLNGSEPLELLLEIGIEKVVKDYDFIFTESKICSAENLKFKEESNDASANTDSDVSGYNIRKSLKTPMHRPTNVDKISASQNTQRKTLIHSKSENYSSGQVDHISGNGFRNSHFELQNVENKLAHLAQIHLVLEHMLLIRSTLNLENVYASFLDDLKKPAKRFHLYADQRTDNREIVVMNPKILAKIDGQLPVQKRITMYSHNKQKQIQNTFFFSIDPIFPPDSFECIPSVDGTTKTNNYYSHQTLTIATRSH